MPQRDDYIDELNKTDALLQFALMHEDREEAGGKPFRGLHLSRQDWFGTVSSVSKILKVNEADQAQ